ncbi:lipopolysaccharide biosynthesis protein [Solibacillus sp. FSL H8-0523]|uniref:lipopolysaccharide biosynthesis protein n=1 Tax=Solibacillus sp. FSL H8-0523 TaxID=2954511 RepID=UPI003100DB42
MDFHLTKLKVLSSLLWKLTERLGVQGIQFIVMIVLARFLLPDDFGLIVLVMVFISMAGIITQGGFNLALIQKKKVEEIDFSSVFYLNLFIALILYILLFFTAPYIASFFEQPQLKFILRILAITLFFNSLSAIQNTIISREFQFKKLFTSTLTASIIAGIVGIAMAYTNYGIWALVGFQLTNQFLVTIILWFTINWRPKFLFSFKRIKRLFSFGWKLLVSSLIDAIDLNIRILLIGKLFNPAILGFYNRGEQFPNLLVNNINGAIQAVMFPTLSSHQDDRNRVKEILRRAIVTSSFIIFPMMVGLAVVAEPLVKLLLTEKWLPAVPFIQIFCAGYALWPIHTANLQAINALGRSDIFLKLEIIKKLLGVFFLIVSIPFGVYAVALSIVVGGVIASFINAYPNSQLLNYSIREQWNDVIPSFLLSIVMGAVIYTIHWIQMSAMLTLLAQVFVGVFIYIGLAALFRLECFSYLVVTLKELLRTRRSIQLKAYKKI